MITDTTMTSPATPHTATATGGGWEVSWLPGRTLDRNQATAAMVIANIVGGKGVPRAAPGHLQAFVASEVNSAWGTAEEVPGIRRDTQAAIAAALISLAAAPLPA
jgi:hypothetical protein